MCWSTIVYARWCLNKGLHLNKRIFQQDWHVFPKKSAIGESILPAWKVEGTYPEIPNNSSPHVYWKLMFSANHKWFLWKVLEHFVKKRAQMQDCQRIFAKTTGKNLCGVGYGQLEFSKIARGIFRLTDIFVVPIAVKIEQSFY